MQSIELPLSPRSLTTKTVVVSTSKAHSEAWRLSVENGLCAPDIYKDPLGCCYKRLDFSIDQRLAVCCISYSLRTHGLLFLSSGCWMNSVSVSVPLCSARQNLVTTAIFCF